MCSATIFAVNFSSRQVSRLPTDLITDLHITGLWGRARRESPFLNKMAGNWVLVLMQGGTTDRKFESIIEQDYGLETDVFYFLVEEVRIFSV